VTRSSTEFLRSSIIRRLSDEPARCAHALRCLDAFLLSHDDWQPLRRDAPGGDELWYSTAAKRVVAQVMHLRASPLEARRWLASLRSAGRQVEVYDKHLSWYLPGETYVYVISPVVFRRAPQ
jgi:hypothetical protein